jgi:hypothetical protein
MVGGCPVKAVGSGGGEDLDLVGLVEVKRGGRRLTALVGGRHRIGRQSERVLAPRVVEDRGQHLAVLVHRARRHAGAVVLAQELRHLRGRDLRGRPIAERLHHAAAALAPAALVWRARLDELRPVAADRRRPGALHVLEPIEPVGGHLAERHRTLARRLLLAGPTLHLIHVLRDELRHPHRRALLVVPAVRYSTAAAMPSDDAVADDPGWPDTALHLAAVVSPLRLVEGRASSSDTDDEGAGWEASDKLHTAARVPPSNGQGTAQGR